MKVSTIFYTLDQNLQNLNSFVFSNFEPKEYSLQIDREVDKYIDSFFKPAQVGTLEGVDEIQTDLDNLRFLKVIDTQIPLTNSEGDLPTNYRNLLNDRSEVLNCGVLTRVPNRVTGDEDLYKIIQNPFTRPKNRDSGPLSRIFNNKIKVYTDNFTVTNVYIDYIRKPIKLFDLGATLGYYDPAFNNYDYAEFPEEALKVILDNVRDRLLELVQADRLNTAVQESQDFGKSK